MTRSIHALLLAEQKKLAYTPSLSISFADNDLPHPSVQDQSLTGASGNPTASCKTTAAIVRAQIQPGAGVYTQKITNPTIASQWETGWTLVDADAYDPALFWTGTHVVLVYQDAAKVVKYRRSSDQGTSWEAATTIWSPAYFLNGTQIGVSGGAGRSGLVYADGTVLHVRHWKGDATGFAFDYTKTMPGTIVSIGAAFVSGNDWILAVIVEDYASWTDSAILIQPYTYQNTFSTPTVYIGVQGQGVASYAYNNIHLTQISATSYWLTYTYSQSKSDGALYDSDDTYIAFSNDGVYFTSGIRLNQGTIADRLQPRTWNTDVYLCSDTVLLKSSPPTTINVATGHVLSYDIEDHGPVAHMHLKLDNRAGTYDALQVNRLGCNITLSRGAVIAGTAYTVTRETFIASRFVRERNGKVLHIEAYNYYRLLHLWHSELTYYYAALTLQNLITTIAALAGIHSATFDADSVWAKTVADFVIQPGQSAGDALAVLQDQYQFVAHISTASTLQCKALSSAPSADYTFTTTPGADHQSIFPEDTNQRTAPDVTHAQVIGADAGGEANALAIQVETGRQFTRRIVREHITTDATAAAAANAIVTRINDSLNRATLICLPAFHLQPYDTITSEDWAAGTASTSTRYITSIRETYNPTRQQELPRRATTPWRMTITLASLVQASQETGINPVTPEELRRIRPLRKGKIVSFDAVTFMAVVRIDDSASAVSMPVAHTVSPANLTAGQRVAVLLFDDTNPYDGVVIASYRGTVTWKQFDRLYASDGSPAPALQTNAAGAILFPAGQAIAEFSIDGTLADNSNAAVPTEQAVKTYVDAQNLLVVPTIVKHYGGYNTTLNSSNPLNTGVIVTSGELYTLMFTQERSNAPGIEDQQMYLVVRNLVASMASLIGKTGGASSYFSAATDVNHQIVISSSSASTRYCRWSAMRLY